MLRLPSRYANYLSNMQRYLKGVKMMIFRLNFFFARKTSRIDCGYKLEPPHCGGSNEYPQSLVRAKIRK